MKIELVLLALLVLLLAAACSAQEAERLEPEVLAEHPHDMGAYTQGLLLHEGSLFESTGLRGDSTLREVAIESGEVLREVALPADLFGEGLARVDDRLIQLTWQAGQAFVYDLATFETIDTFTYEGEGWGLCYDGAQLYMSNGSSTLTMRDPETFEVTGEITVTLNGERIPRLNELECVQGSIYANVYLTNFIVRIDPESGRVTGVIDASGLLPDAQRVALEPGEVLNGIAYNPERDSFYITGKNWPKLFEVRFE